jgi:hypothetical protein
VLWPVVNQYQKKKKTIELFLCENHKKNINYYLVSPKKNKGQYQIILSHLKKTHLRHWIRIPYNFKTIVF